MGEKIKTIAEGKIQDVEFEIELNHPPAKGMNKQIHIQSKAFRMEMDEADFIKYGLSVYLAQRNLKDLKNIE